MTEQTVPAAGGAPSHVPPELIIPFDFNADKEFLADPYGAFARVHLDRPRIFYTPGHYAGWVVTRYDDVKEVLQRPEVFSSKGSADFTDDDAERTWQMIPLELDPPVHAKYRALLNPVLSPKEVDRLDDTIRRVTTDLLDGFIAKGGCDFIADFARRMPTSVFVGLMGLPAEQVDTFVEWTVELVHSDDPERQGVATNNILGFLHQLVAERAAEPRDDLVSKILALRIDDRPIDAEEVIGFCFLLFVAGLDTVTSMLGNVFRFLAENDAERRRLSADPALIPDAVEELLRAFSVVNLNRRVVEDVEFAGVGMRKGDRILIFLPAANLDPKEFAHPQNVDFDRQNNRHLAFSAGPHRCAGSHLARRELRIALDEFLKRIPDFAIGLNSELGMHGGGVLGQNSLHLTWKTDAANAVPRK